MKIFSFIKWQWNKFEAWQKVWIFSAFFFGAGVTTDGPIGTVLIIVPMLVVFAYALKWFLWDAVKTNYNQFKQEQNNLFENIKNSDKK